MNDAEFEHELKRQIDELPKQVKPGRDLWAGIDHAIEQQQSNSRSKLTKLSAVAASVAVIGLSAWLSFNIEMTPSNPTSGENLQYVSLMTESFKEQKQALLVKYQDTQPHTDNWRVQLQELDEAAIAIKKVLDTDPTNAQLIKMLQHTYQQQLDLINAVNQNPWQAI